MQAATLTSRSIHVFKNSMYACEKIVYFFFLITDRVLVTTDQMVAEYIPSNDDQLCNNTITRRSDMVRDWCDKTSLAMNKLYPTILNETYSLFENEHATWGNAKSGDFSIDLNANRNTISTNINDTEASFKTCSSRETYNIEISGIQRLERTFTKTKDHCDCEQSCNGGQRFSVYENFSLPGSPSCIAHRNYNSKTSLKRCRNGGELCAKMQGMTMTCDGAKHVDLDKALAVVQNETNEWLSTCSSEFLSETRAGNTRRSSASSGVSSNYSGGNIVIANVQEEYKYEDKEEGVVLIEKRLLVSPVV